MEVLQYDYVMIEPVPFAEKCHARGSLLGAPADKMTIHHYMYK